MSMFNNNEQELGMSLNTKPTLFHNLTLWVGCVMLFIDLYLIFIYSDIEKTMGVVQKIFYFHVGTAWNAFFAFFVVFVCSILYLITKKRIYDVIATVSAEIGVIFTMIVLTTGPIWAKSAWNIWWSWEPRLTSTLILLFIYIAYIMIRHMDAAWDRIAKWCAVFGIIGFLDVPIVYYSVKWWNSKLHPIVVGDEGGGLEPDMLFTMFFSLATMFIFYIILMQKGIRVEKAKIELQHIKTKITDKFTK